MANQGALYRVELNNTSVTGPKGQLFRAEVDSTVAAGPSGLFYRASLVVQAVSGPQGIVYRVELRTPASADAGDDQTNIEPFTTVTLVGSDTASVDDNRVWTQISGPAVTDLTPAGRLATFTAPGSATDQTLVFGYVAGGSPQSTVQVFVLQATEKAVVGGVLVPIKFLSVKL